jgi:hypothetical protein
MTKYITLSRQGSCYGDGILQQDPPSGYGFTATKQREPFYAGNWLRRRAIRMKGSLFRPASPCDIVIPYSLLKDALILLLLVFFLLIFLNKSDEITSS